jgi:hypothetical protein
MAAKTLLDDPSLLPYIIGETFFAVLIVILLVMAFQEVRLMRRRKK